MSIFNKKPSKKLYAHVIMDRSGSMASMRSEAVAGYREYCDTLRLIPDTDVHISLTIFDSQSVDLIRDNAKPETAKISEIEFVPRGMTPLFDAIGRTLPMAEARAKALGTEIVSVLVVTDGQENDSKEYKRERIKEMIEAAQKAGWQFQFIGANQDSWANASGLGYQAGTTMDYKNIRNAFTASANSAGRYAHAGGGVHGQSLGNYTQEERDSAFIKGAVVGGIGGALAGAFVTHTMGQGQPTQVQPWPAPDSQAQAPQQHYDSLPPSAPQEYETLTTSWGSDNDTPSDTGPSGADE